MTKTRKVLRGYQVIIPNAFDCTAYSTQMDEAAIKVEVLTSLYCGRLTPAEMEATEVEIYQLKTDAACKVFIE